MSMRQVILQTTRHARPRVADAMPTTCMCMSMVQGAADGRTTRSDSLDRRSQQTCCPTTSSAPPSAEQLALPTTAAMAATAWQHLSAPAGNVSCAGGPAMVPGLSLLCAALLACCSSGRPGSVDHLAEPGAAMPRLSSIQHPSGCPLVVLPLLCLHQGQSAHSPAYLLAILQVHCVPVGLQRSCALPEAVCCAGLSVLVDLRRGNNQIPALEQRLIPDEQELAAVVIAAQARAARMLHTVLGASHPTVDRVLYVPYSAGLAPAVAGCMTRIALALS